MLCSVSHPECRSVHVPIIISVLIQVDKTCRRVFNLLKIYVSAESSIYFNKVIRRYNDHCDLKHNFQFETSPSTITYFHLQ